MNHVHPLSLLLSLFLAPIAAASAAEGLAQTIAPDVTIRLIASDRVVDGEMAAAIELKMPDTTTTYWRVPGETGIPLTLSLNTASTVDEVEVHWPLPTRVVLGGYVDHVYSGHVIFPLTVHTEHTAPFLDVSLVLGVCDEVCTPVKADLTLQTDNEPDSASSVRIAQAMSRVPIPWNKTPFLGPEALINAEEKSVIVPVTQTVWLPDSLIAATADPSIVFSAPTESEGHLVFRLLGRNVDKLLQQDRLQLVFDTIDGPYAIDIPLKEMLTSSAQ